MLRVVVKCWFGDVIDDCLMNLLKKLGLIIFIDCLIFVICYFFVIGIFVYLFFVVGVLKVLEVFFLKMVGGLFFKIVGKRFLIDEKCVLRLFLVSVC